MLFTLMAPEVRPIQLERKVDSRGKETGHVSSYRCNMVVPPSSPPREDPQVASPLTSLNDVHPLFLYKEEEDSHQKQLLYLPPSVQVMQSEKAEQSADPNAATAEKLKTTIETIRDRNNIIYLL
jgi:hypothetical protein